MGQKQQTSYKPNLSIIIQRLWNNNVDEINNKQNEFQLIWWSIFISVASSKIRWGSTDFSIIPGWKMRTGYEIISVIYLRKTITKKCQPNWWYIYLISMASSKIAKLKTAEIDFNLDREHISKLWIFPNGMFSGSKNPTVIITNSIFIVWPWKSRSNTILHDLSYLRLYYTNYIIQLHYTNSILALILTFFESKNI